MQHHALHRSPWSLAPVGATPRRRLHRAGLLEMQPGGGVAELVTMALDQLLVEVLDRKLLISLMIQPSMRSSSSTGARFGDGWPTRRSISPSAPSSS
jgi:hypothetical protein